MQTKDERTNASHEVMQQLTLAGLYKAGFFNRAVFYGDILSLRDFGESELLPVCKLKHTVKKVLARRDKTAETRDWRAVRRAFSNSVGQRPMEKAIPLTARPEGAKAKWVKSFGKQ
jgi:hypothetical protein